MGPAAMPLNVLPRRPSNGLGRNPRPGPSRFRHMPIAILVLCPVLGAGAAQAQIRFGPASNYTAGPGPRAVALGDLDRDGRPDLVAVVNGSHTMSVRRNQGDGTLGPAQTFATGPQPVHVALAHLDADANLDAVVANQSLGENTVSLLFGNGDGTFDPRMDLHAGEMPTFIALGDLNHDNRPDIVVANNGASFVTVLINLGGRAFSAGLSHPLGGLPLTAAIGQLDADGHPDVAVGGGTSFMTLFPGRGNGNFFDRTAVALQAPPSTVAITDMNRDGRQDLVIALYTFNRLSVFHGNGSGGFSAPAHYTTGSAPVSAAVADMSGDGWPDALVANFSSSSVSIFHGDGLGGLNALPSLATPANPISVAAGDVNGDGLPDLATANAGGTTVSVFMQVPSPPLIRVLPGSIDFGAGFLGAAEIRSVRVQNIGSQPLQITSATIAGPEFSLLDAAPFTLARGQFLELRVRYARGTTGNAAGSLTIVSTDATRPVVVVALSGSAVLPPTTQVSPASVVLAAPVGAVDTELLTVRNAGMGSLTFGLATVGARPPWLTFFPASGSLAPGDSEQVLIRGDGAQLLGGTYEAVLRVASNDPLRPGIDVPVTLVVTGTPRITVFPAGFDFGVGYLGYPVTIGLQIANPGTGVLTVSSIRVDSAGFRVSGPTSLTVPPGQSRGSQVTCLRDMTGSASATLTVESDAAGSPIVDVPLTAETVDPPRIVVAPTELPRVSVAVGDTVIETLTVSNAGHGDPLVVYQAIESEGLPWPPPFAIRPNTASIGPGASAEFEVVYFGVDRPGQDFAATLVVYSNDPAIKEVFRALLLHVHDLPTPVAASLASSEVEADRVWLVWHAAGVVHPMATIYRTRGAESWRALLEAEVDDGGRIVCEDRAVVGGERYGYRLGLREGGIERMVGEVWVETPAAHLALHGIRPTPSVADPLVSFSLPDRRGGRLELLDVNGRRWMDRSLDRLGPGRHEVVLATRGVVPPGLYWVRLTCGARSLIAPAILLR